MRPGEIDVRALKERALEFFKKGKFARSAETWSEICKADPKDNQSRLRCGDALTKAGQQAHAYEAYRLAAEGFARQGFLPQAVAAAKLALTLSPDDEAVKKLLADFHAERFGSRPLSTPASGAVDAVQAAVLDAAVASAPPEMAAPVLSAPRPVRILARRPSGILNPAEVAAGESAAPIEAGTPVLADAPRPSRIIAAQSAPLESGSAPRLARGPDAESSVEQAAGGSEALAAAPQRPSRIIAAQAAPPESSSTPRPSDGPEAEAVGELPNVGAAPTAPSAEAFEVASTPRSSRTAAQRSSRVIGPVPSSDGETADARIGEEQPAPLNTPPRRSRGAASAQVPPAPPLSTPPSAQPPTGEAAPDVASPLSTPPGPRGGPLDPLSTPPVPQRSRTSAPSSGAALPAQVPEAAPRGTPPHARTEVPGAARSTPPPALPALSETAPPLSTPPLRPPSESAQRPRGGPSTPARPLPRAPQNFDAKAAPTPPPGPPRASRSAHRDDASPTPPPAQRRAKSTPPVGVQPSGAATHRPAQVNSTRRVDEAAATPPPPRARVEAVGEEAAPTPPPAPPRPSEAPNQGVENVTVPFDPAMIAELRSRISTSDATVVAMSPLPAEAPPVVLPPNDVGDGEYLARVPLFAELTSEAFSTLLQAAPMVRLAAGEVAVEQHALGDSLFAILSGRVRVFRDEPTGRRELAILEAGGVFGEMSLVTGANRSAWVVAEVDDTTLLQVSKQLLVELSSSSPSIARALASLAQRRILANLMATEPIFSGLKRNERLELIERFEVKEVARGQVLVGPSSELGGLFVLTSGELEAVDNRGAVALSPVVLLGDAALLGSEVLTHFMATTRSQVLHLPADHALRLTKHPSVAARRPELLDAALRRLQG